MPVSIKDFGLDRLSVADRILLVHELWDSISASPEAVTLTDAQQQDLERRLQEHRGSPYVWQSLGRGQGKAAEEDGLKLHAQ